MIVEEVPLVELSPHPENPRQGDVGAIVASIERFGLYQPIVVQRSTGYVLAGNHRWKVAVALDRFTIPVVYVDVDDAEARAILVADNRTSDLATYDEPALADLLRRIAEEERGLQGTGFDGEDLDRLLSDVAEAQAEAAGGGEPEAYTGKVEAPVYEPRGDRPPVEALADLDSRNALLAEVEASDVPEDVRAFLRLAAERHVRFDYEAIAEFYAHAEPAVRALMEASALVIIDYRQAVERAFVQLNEDLGEAFARDYPDA